MKQLLRYSRWFILICLLQILIFERIQLGPYLSPCIYVLFILLFPFGYNTLWLLLWSFAMGLCVDIFSAGALGLHASAATCLGLFRSGIIKMVTTKGDVDQLATPGLTSMGLLWYLVYVIFSLLTHHIVLFGLENYHFNYLFPTVMRIFCSAFLNTLLIVLFQITFFSRKRESEN